MTEKDESKKRSLKYTYIKNTGKGYHTIVYVMTSEDDINKEMFIEQNIMTSQSSKL